MYFYLIVTLLKTVIFTILFYGFKKIYNRTRIYFINKYSSVWRRTYKNLFSFR